MLQFSSNFYLSNDTRSKSIQQNPAKIFFQKLGSFYFAVCLLKILQFHRNYSIFQLILILFMIFKGSLTFTNTKIKQKVCLAT